MKLGQNITDQMCARLMHEVESIEANQSKMAEIEGAYNTYVDICEDQKRRLERVQRLVSILDSGDLLLNAIKLDDTQTLGRALAPPISLSLDIPLWEAMKEYLSYVKEAGIEEIVSFLKRMNIKTANRQAIESVLKRHPETFRTRKSGHNKFIALKTTDQR